jgi:FMN phosphatase YigB (HAD superfamily)
MTQSLGLREAADYFGIELSPDLLEYAERSLEEELANISAFPDALEAVALLQRAGHRLGVCSNLAQPYGSAIRYYFPGLDAYGFSFEIGSVKPEPMIYQTTCKLLGVQPSCGFGGQARVMMIGDSQRCDRDGPRAF